MKKNHLNSQKNHTSRWYDGTQPYKISCPNSTSSVRYKNNKFLFLYLTNEVEFGQDILQDCISSYHLHMWFFGEFRQLFYRSLHEFSRSYGLHQICSRFTGAPEFLYLWPVVKRSGTVSEVTTNTTWSTFRWRARRFDPQIGRSQLLQIEATRQDEETKEILI